MVYSNAEEMIYMIKNHIINYNYKKPNTNILTISYWISEMNKKINLLRS